MEKWVAYALLSMVFAGVTAVIAKVGLTGISGELGLAVRTVFVFVFVLALAWLLAPRAELGAVTRHNLVWLGLSGLTTTLSWWFYYRALKVGEVSTIALIDKGSFVVAAVLAWLFLKEQITARVVIGSVLILAGLVVVARK
jgi:bacterial/archaeal transporter family protein